MVPYVDNFSVTVASESPRTNVRRLQEIFLILARKGRAFDAEFSISKKELVYWRTPSLRLSPPSLSPVSLGGPGLPPRPGRLVVRPLAYPPLELPTTPYQPLGPRRSLLRLRSKALLPTGRCLTFPRSRDCPRPAATNRHIRHRPLIPNTRSHTALNLFWHRVCR